MFITSSIDAIMETWKRFIPNCACAMNNKLHARAPHVQVMASLILLRVRARNTSARDMYVYLVYTTNITRKMIIIMRGEPLLVASGATI